MSKTKDSKSAPGPSSLPAGMDGIQDDSVPMPSLPASDAIGASTPKPRGYPLNILNGKADEKFCCSYCKYILRNPMQNSCGHRFCQDCLKMMETLPPPMQCQSCVDEGNTDGDSFLVFKEAFEDKAAIREMKKLQVKCTHPGCQWKGLFNDFIKHEEDCERKLVPCTQCGASVSKARLLNHETKSCPKRDIQCNYCREEIVYEFREKHNEECPMFLVKCEKCQTPVERYKLLSHQETVCANRIMTCPLPDCITKLPMDKFLPHISKDENLARHVTHLLDKSEVTDQRLQTLEDRLHCGIGVDSSLSTDAVVADAVQAQASAGYSPESISVAVRTQGDGAQAEGGGGGLSREYDQKLKLHEDLMSVLHSEILRCITKGEALGRSMEKSDTRLRDCYKTLENLNTRLSNLEAAGNVRPSDPAQYGELVSEGSRQFTWIIKNYSKVKQDACQREREMICSPVFYTCPGGYQLKLKLYPNGEGLNKTKNVSLFLQFLNSPFNDLLLWPFSPKVHFMLVDQVDFQHHHIKVYEADPMSPSSRQPSDDGGIASGCPAFISVQNMTQKYYPKDTVYLKFLIEMPEANMDRLNALSSFSHVRATSTTSSSSSLS